MTDLSFSTTLFSALDKHGIPGVLVVGILVLLYVFLTKFFNWAFREPDPNKPGDTGGRLTRVVDEHIRFVHNVDKYALVNAQSQRRQVDVDEKLNKNMQALRVLAQASLDGGGRHYKLNIRCIAEFAAAISALAGDLNKDVSGPLANIRKIIEESGEFAIISDDDWSAFPPPSGIDLQPQDGRPERRRPTPPPSPPAPRKKHDH